MGEANVLAAYDMLRKPSFFLMNVLRSEPNACLEWLCGNISLILLSRICGADIENTLEHYLILGATAVKSLAQAVASVVVPV